MRLTQESPEDSDIDTEVTATICSICGLVYGSDDSLWIGCDG